MTESEKIAKRLQEVLIDGNWVASTNLKDQLSDITWQQATHQIQSNNTIALLAFHIGYYVAGLLNVFKTGRLEIRDKYSFDCPPINCQEDWENLLKNIWKNSNELIKQIKNMDDDLLDKTFVDDKYGDYSKNLNALIEHTYYHLGQIVIQKK